MYVVPGNISIARLTEPVAFTGWEVEPRRLEISEYPHGGRLLRGLACTSKVTMVLIGHLCSIVWQSHAIKYHIDGEYKE